MFDQSPIKTNPIYIEQNKLLIELQLKKQELEKDKQNKLSSIINFKSEAEKRADEILRGQDGEIKTTEELYQSIGHLDNEIKALGIAISKQQKIIEGTIRKISLEVCDKARPQYKKLIENMSKTLIEFIKATEEEREFWDELFQHGVSRAGLHVGVYAGIQPGELKENYHQAAYWARDMIEHGYLSASMFPKEKRKQWNLDSVKVSS